MINKYFKSKKYDLKTGDSQRANTVLNNNRGITLVVVILVIAILGILAAVAIESTGSDIINAGDYMSSEQVLNISNSAMNITISQLNTDRQTNAGIGLPIANIYYYTPTVNGTLQQSDNHIALTEANIDLGFSNILGFTVGGGNFGFEYKGTYGSFPGYSLTYYFYNGKNDTIAQNQSASKTVRTGMTFSYGPVHEGY
jgi:type II secretory pathway pseudopilin PulG